MFSSGGNAPRLPTWPPAGDGGCVCKQAWRGGPGRLCKGHVSSCDFTDVELSPADLRAAPPPPTARPVGGSAVKTSCREGSALKPLVENFQRHVCRLYEQQNPCGGEGQIHRCSKTTTATHPDQRLLSATKDRLFSFSLTCI